MWQDSEKISGQSIGKGLLTLAVPAVMSTFFTVIFEIIDMFWVGRLGADAIAAISTSSYFIWMLRGLAMAVATGSLALVSRRTGEKNESGLLSALTYGLLSTFVFSVMTMAAFFPVAVNIFRWLSLEPQVAELAVEYSLVFLAGAVFVYMMMTLEYVIRGLGDTRTPMIITGVSLLLNIVLDPIFMFNFNMGLKGAAYATISAQAVGALLMAVELLRKLPALNRKLSVSRSASKPGFTRQFYKILKIGLPVGLSDAAFCLIYLLLTGIVDMYGKEPLAALGIAHRLEGLPFFVCLGFSMAVSPMVGQFLGAGKPLKAKQTAFLSLKITCAILFGIAVIYFTFAPELCKLFTDDPEIIRQCVLYLRMVVFFDVFLPLEVVLGGAFSGAGDTRPPFFIIFPITVLRIPLAYLVAAILKWSIAWIWVVIIITMVAKGILMLWVFSKGNWARKLV